jgi:nucleoside-diphosphate-sugar epimerase
MGANSDLFIVTGALGWLGRRLVETLAGGLPGHGALGTPRPGVRLRALVLPGQDPAPLLALSGRVEVVAGDIRSESDCARLCRDAQGAVLFHTAGVIHPRRVKEFYEVNVRGSANLVGAARRAGVRRAILVSSNSPCGCNATPDGLFDEDSPYHPFRNYGRSKMLMEIAALDRGKRGDMEVVIIRAPWFYGLNQPARQTLFFRMVREGKAPIVGDGSNRRSMTYIDNLCQGLMLAARNPAADGKVYWIADRRPYSMNEIVGTIERLLETEFGRPCAHKRLRLPAVASSAADAADALLQSVGAYNQKIHVLSEMNKTIACSVERAARELGYVPAVDLEEGMRRSIRWCIEHGEEL